MQYLRAVSTSTVSGEVISFAQLTYIIKAPVQKSILSEGKDKNLFPIIMGEYDKPNLTRKAHIMICRFLHVKKETMADSIVMANPNVCRIDLKQRSIQKEEMVLTIPTYQVSSGVCLNTRPVC